MNERREDWLLSEQFRVVQVSSLPYAHNPSRCDNAGLFAEADWDGAAGRRFFESLTDQQRRSCHYHQLADWKLVAMISVRFFRACRDELMSKLDAALSRQDSRELYWLFHDPIAWGGEAPYVTNGQHRICAIRASGARLCVIDHERFDPYTAPSL